MNLIYIFKIDWQYKYYFNINYEWNYTLLVKLNCKSCTNLFSSFVFQATQPVAGELDW